MKTPYYVLLALLLAVPVQAALLQPQDFAAIAQVSGPRLSPDGRKLVYSVGTTDLAKDRNVTHLWLASWDGRDNRQLTSGKRGESNPAFSPDGSRLAFIANRGNSDDDPAQVWIIDLRGGEAQQASFGSGDVSDFDWAPDGQHLVMVVDDPDPADTKTADSDAKKSDGDDDDEDEPVDPPIVITRYQFKQDIDGYLGEQHSHLAMLDLQSGAITPLTSGDHDDLLPAFSPNGRHIAFVSKRGDDPDRSDNWDLYVLDLAIDDKGGVRERQLSSSPEADLMPDWETHPAWSPDSKQIAYLHGSDPKLIEYGTHGLALIDAAGGTPKLLLPKLDRNLSALRWIDQGRRIVAIVEQDRHSQLVDIDARSGKISTLSDGGGSVGDFDALPSGRIAMLASTPSKPSEVYALDGSELRPLSRQAEAFIGGVQLGKVEEIGTRSKDGNEVHGFVTYPPGYVAGTPCPTLLFLHGGPASQFEATFRFDWQLFAANGYVVITMNPRGSTGRGTDYAAAIYADWGNKDVIDVLGAVDAMVGKGVADPQRLVVGGWSYGGMLTNYVIASDTRFKAAVSGASISNILAGYGTDEYIRDYDYELGKPWEHLDVWMRISYPFLHADRIKTPTLFMGGSEDYNVPLQNVQQMYQALQGLNVPTQLVIYPGQHHGLDQPSYLLDRWQRWIGWYRDHLQ